MFESRIMCGWRKKIKQQEAQIDVPIDVPPCQWGDMAR